jgi:hypothetical protein
MLEFCVAANRQTWFAVAIQGLCQKRAEQGLMVVWGRLPQAGGNLGRKRVKLDRCSHVFPLFPDCEVTYSHKQVLRKL